MRKNETIEITLHTDRKSLVAMIKSLVGNRKPVDEEKNFSTEKKFLGRQNFKKKISSPS